MRILFVAIVVFTAAQPLLAQGVKELVQQDCNNCARSHYWGSVDVLSWTPHMRGLDYAISEEGSAFTVGIGQVHEVDYDRDAGFRTQIGFDTSVGWGVGFGYTHFGTEGRDTITRPPGAGQLFATFSHPGGPAEADVASATASFDFDVLDVVASRNVVDSRYIGVNLYGGIRWADISQQLGSQFDGRNFTNGVINSSTDVNAFGFRFGGQTHWRMASGWSAFGNVSVAAMYGQFDNHRFESNVVGNVTQIRVDLRDRYSQATFNMDSSLGVAWQHDSWQFSGGYELNVWTNMGESLRFVDNNEPGSFAAVTGDLLLEGFFFRLAKSW